MLRIFLIVILIIYFAPVKSQLCSHADLSLKYIFDISLQRFTINQNNPDSCIISITVINKKNKTPVQTITLSSLFLFANAFTDCNAARSYVTGKNKNAPVIDNEFGDLIVADFNFDGEEDFAVKNNSGGNGGPTYSYYINNKNRFKEDLFLTHQMEFFPTAFHAKKYTLTTLVHASAVSLCKTTYQYNATLKSWKKISRRFIGY